MSYNNTPQKIRQSNFEALRIVAMIMIILNHSMLLGPHYMGYDIDHPYTYSEQGVMPVFLNSATVLSVNMFVLISGWFGIHRVVKSAVRILIDVAVYGLASYIICSLVMGEALTLNGIGSSMSLSNWWYPYTYLILVFVSPILEMALARRSDESVAGWQRRAMVVVACLAVVGLFFGWQWKITDMNGYNIYVFHFFFLYSAARLLRIYLENNHRVSKRLLAALFAFSVTTMTCGFVCQYGLRDIVPSPGAILTGWFAHNNPLMILSSFTLFALFAQLNIRRRWINVIATTVFGVYLTHTSPMGTRPVSVLSQYLFDHLSYAGLLVCTFVVFLLYGVVVYVINRVKDPAVNYVLSRITEVCQKRFTRS